VIIESATVEDDGGDVGLFGARGEQFGDGLGTGDVATAALLEIGLDRRAEARVRPATSSMIWAEMCLLVRETATRGRSAVPERRRRMRA